MAINLFEAKKQSEQQQSLIGGSNGTTLATNNARKPKGDTTNYRQSQQQVTPKVRQTDNPYANRAEVVQNAQQPVTPTATAPSSGNTQSQFAQDKNAGYGDRAAVKQQEFKQQQNAFMKDPHDPSFWNGNAQFNQKAREVAYGIDPNTGEAVTNEKAAHLGGMATGVNIDKKGNAPGTKAWRDSITSDKQREKEEKNNRTRLGILAIGDALRHMGNLYYTTKGATPQQFNSPVVDEYNRQEADRKEKQASQLAKEKLAYERSQDEIKNQIALGNLANGTRGVQVKEAQLENDKKKADAYAKTQESVQKKNEADKDRIKASADNIAQQARLNGVKADNQGALMQSQTNANNARAAKSRSGIAVDASTIAKNKAATAKAWQEVGQGQSGVKVNSYYGQLTRNRKAAPTNDQVANMYNRLSNSGLIDTGTQSNIAAILAKGESSETTQKQMNAIQKALTQGTPKQRQLVAHELIGAGWYQTTTSAQKRQIATAKANIAKGATAAHKAQTTSVRGKIRVGTKTTTTTKPQAISSRSVV